MAQQQIGFFGKFQPTGSDTSGADKLRMLAGLSSQVGDIAFQKGAKQRQKEGSIAGAQSVKRGDDGKILSPELESDNTIFGESFNQAAIMAHKSQISMDARTDLDRLQDKHKLDPELFKAAAIGRKRGILTGMPEELAIIVSGELDSAISNRHAKLLGEHFKRESTQQRAIALDSMESLQDDLLNDVRGGVDITSKLVSANAELDAWVETGKISADEARKIKEDSAERIQEQEALSDIDNIVFNEDLSLEEQFEKGTNFVKSLRDKRLKDLSPEQKDSLVRVVESKVADIGRNISALGRERDIAKEKVISDLKIEANLIEEKASQGDKVDFSSLVERVEILHNKGDISSNERTSLGTHIEKAIGEFNRISLADKRIIARMDGDNSIVIPQKDSDFFYKRKIKDSIDSMPPELQGVAKSNYILKTRTIPSQIKDEITSNVLSGDPELIKQSADLVDRIDNIPGMANMAVTSNQRAFIENVVMLSDSLAPEQAIKEARKLTDPSNKARVDAREAEIKEDKLRKDYIDDVDDEFDLVDNINKERVAAEFGRLFESFFKNGMEKDAARNKAFETIGNNWKESEFGFMKHRPEDFYSVAGDTDYIKQDLIRSLRGGVGLEFDEDDVFLFADDETSRKASMGQPDYKVMVIDNNGQMKVMDGRWFPDQKAQENKIQKKLEEKIKRERVPKFQFPQEQF